MHDVLLSVGINFLIGGGGGGAQCDRLMLQDPVRGSERSPPPAVPTPMVHTLIAACLIFAKWTTVWAQHFEGEIFGP